MPELARLALQNRWVRRGASLAAALLLALAGWGAIRLSRSATVSVQVANGFQKTLEVELGDRRAEVAPNTVESLAVPAGTHRARATVEGALVDDAPLKVVGGHDAFIWNVGGVAPLFKGVVSYYATPSAWSSPPRFSSLCGQRVVAERHVDFLFREPDSSVTVTGQNPVTRVLLGARWKAADEPGRPPCISWLYAQADPRLSGVADALEAAGELSLEDEALPIVAALVAGADEGVWERARALHARRSDDLAMELVVLWASQETGHLEEYVEELSARRAQAPDDADLAYLALRAKPLWPSLRELEAVLEKFPTHSALRGAAQTAALREGQWERLLSLWKIQMLEDPWTACQSGAEVARAAVELRREAQVLRYLQSCHVDGDLPLEVALAATRLAMAAQQDSAPWLARVTNEAQAQRLRLLAGLSLESGGPTLLSSLASLFAAARQSDEALFAALPNLPREELMLMDSELATLVWAEALRQNHSASSTLARRTQLTASERQVLRDFLSGATPEAEFEAERFTPLVRATVRFVRSRSKELPPQEKARLRELARKEAVLSGFLADAIEHWPR